MKLHEILLEQTSYNNKGIITGSIKVYLQEIKATKEDVKAAILKVKAGSVYKSLLSNFNPVDKVTTTGVISLRHKLNNKLYQISPNGQIRGNPDPAPKNTRWYVKPRANRLKSAEPIKYNENDFDQVKAIVQNYNNALKILKSKKLQQND